jgi:hypothetical protein
MYYRVINWNKHTILVGDVDQELVGVRAEGNLCTLLQFYCGPQRVLKNKIFFFFGRTEV